MGACLSINPITGPLYCIFYLITTPFYIISYFVSLVKTFFNGTALLAVPARLFYDNVVLPISNTAKELSASLGGQFLSIQKKVDKVKALFDDVRTLSDIRKAQEQKRPISWSESARLVISKVLKITSNFIGALSSIWFLAFYFIVTILLWFFLFRPYFTVTEVYPHYAMSVLGFSIKGVTDFVNFFIIVWNGTVDIFINPLLPLYWELELMAARLIRLMYEVGSAIITGGDVSFEESITNGENTRNLAGQAITTPDIYSIDKTGDAYEGYLNAIWVIVVFVQTAFDVLFIMFEILARVWVFYADVVIFFVKMIETVIVCLGANFALWILVAIEFIFQVVILLINMIIGIINLPFIQPINPDSIRMPYPQALLVGVPCECSSKEGGWFKDLGGCQTRDLDCVATTNERGRTIWNLLDSEKKVINSGPNRNQVCSNTPDNTNLRRALLGESLSLGLTHEQIKELEETDRIHCIRSCIRNPSDPKNSWYMRKCPQSERQYYVGKCDLTKDKTLFKLESNFTLATKEHISDYTKHTKFREEDVLFFPDFESANEKEEFPASKGPVNFDAFKQIVSVLESKPIDPEKSLFVCEKTPEASDLLFEHYLYRALCIYTKITSNAKLDDAIRYSIDPLSSMKMNRKLSTVQEPSRKKRRKTYAGSFRQLMESTSEPVHLLTRLKTFRRSLVEAHREHINIYFPESPSSIGNGTTFLETSFENIRFHVQQQIEIGYKSPKQELQKQRKAARRRLDVPDGSVPSEPKPNNPMVEYGDLTFACSGVDICPDLTCPPEGDLSKCHPPANVTVASVLISPAYYLVTAFEKIDFEYEIETILSCWSNAIDNPTSWPGSKENLKIYRETGKVNGEFCPLMIGYFPTFPYITWNLQEFIKENCAYNLQLPMKQQPCTCPQYMSFNGTYDLPGEWMPGIDRSVELRLFNGYKVSQLIYTQFTPPFIQSLWAAVLGIFISEQSNPELWNVFNYQYARGGLTDGQNEFCILMHLGSFYFTYAFFILPIIVVFIACSEFIMDLAELALFPFSYIVDLWLTYLLGKDKQLTSDYAKKASVAVYDPTRKKIDIYTPDDDFGSIQKSSLIESDIKI